MWRRIAQSLQGSSHAADDSPCQDNFSLRVFDGDSTHTLLACVSDGAGSAEHSEVGSSIVCSTIVECAEAFLAAGGRIGQTPARTTSSAGAPKPACSLEREAANFNCEVRELASTLCAAIVSPARSCFFQIGDGVMVLRRSGVYGVVFWPQSGEYANSTNFLTSHQLESQLEFLSVDSACDDIALMTDGLERLALRFDTQTPHEPFFAPFFRALRAAEDYTGLNDALQSFLGSQPVRERSDDDKTLILASFIDQTEDAV